MRFYQRLILVLLGLFILSCAKPATHLIPIRYQPEKRFPSLQQTIGSTLGLAPFQDERTDRLYIGIHTPLQGVSSYFKSEPFPLENAIKDSLLQTLPRLGVKVIQVQGWDNTPESLKRIKTDSVLMLEIKKFWAESKATLFKTDVKTSIHLVLYLGVKREEKVFKRNVVVEREVTLLRLTPERMEEMVSKILGDIFDSFFSNPYESS